MLRKFTLTAIALATLAGCTDSETFSSKGQFVDAPVAGLSYAGSTGISGTTDAQGRFEYAPGSTVTFSLGGVTFPAVTPGSVVTPVDLVGASSPDHPGAVAIARFMQSLDADGDPENGITVDKSKMAPAAIAPAKWADANDATLTSLLAGTTSLKTESAARQHMSAQWAKVSGLPKMSLVGRYTSGGTIASPSLVAEIIAYHANSKSLFITSDTSAEPSSFKRLDLSSLPSTTLANGTTSTNLTVASTTSVATHVNSGGFEAGGVQSLDVSGDLLAIAVQAKNKTDNGVVAFYQLDSKGAATFLKKVTVGSLPDGVAFSPDGKYLVVANEGELSTTFYSDGIDPEGSISIIPINLGMPSDSATTLDFKALNVGGSRNSELPKDVRIGRAGASVAQDLEPEFVSISEDSKTAYVTLQENNAVAVVNLETKQISKILALGFKDYGSKNKLAASDKIAPTTATPPGLNYFPNLYGVYMPDGIASFTLNGKTYFITANEGDDRDDFLRNDTLALGTAETKRFASLTASLDATAFPADKVALWKDNTVLGRLTLMATDANGKYGDTDGDGDYDRLYVLGGRSFSIWDASTGTQVYDSGEDVERIVYNNASDDATNGTTLLNAAQMLGRLDNKGPEPESVVVGKVGSDTYAFIGLERASGILMYQITNPAKPKFVQYIRNTTTLADGDISPEGLKFIPADKSPTGQALLAVGHEVTGSVAIYQIK